MAITQLKVDCGKLLEAFYHYNNHQKLKISRAEFEKNLHEKIMSEDFLSDANHVLPARTPWDPKDAFRIISEKLIAQLMGNPWKGIQVNSKQ